jgi:thymidylate synthase (FAD)
MSKVSLIAYTQNPEKIVAAAARICYSPDNIEKIFDEMSDEKACSLIKMLSDMGHESPFEHVSFTFAIEGVSRALLAQITRHRIASFSVQSQRYVKENNFEYVIPKEIENLKPAKELFQKAVNQDIEQYNNLVKILVDNHAKNLLAKGYKKKESLKLAEKYALEDARFILPNACTTKMICTFNARSLMNFFLLRCCNRAQWEIRKVANEMYSLVYSAAPAIFANSGPGCLFGRCPEGKMSCKKQDEIKALFKRLKGGIK